MDLPPQINEWLNLRGIPDAVITGNNISWNGSQIVIPVLSNTGAFLFNKYRRNPFGPTNIPKYKYDIGMKSQLFNAHKITATDTVILVEGELDALRLEAEGYIAVSSTGGSGSFPNEWLPLLEGKNVYICFDNDDAGVRGAVRLLTKLPAKLVLVPRMTGVKDITEYLQRLNHRPFTALLEEAREYPMLREEVPEIATIQNGEQIIKQYKNYISDLQKTEKIAKDTGQAWWQYDYIQQPIWTSISNIRSQIKRRRFAKTPIAPGLDITNADIMRVKQIPIENFYTGKLRRRGLRLDGICPFHLEKTASFVIYTDKNRWWCYGACATGGSVIDFVMRLDGCDFITAVKKLV